MSHAVFVFPFYNSDAIEKQKPAHFVFNVYINSTFHSHIAAASGRSKEASGIVALEEQKGTLPHIQNTKSSN